MFIKLIILCFIMIIAGKTAFSQFKLKSDESTESIKLKPVNKENIILPASADNTLPLIYYTMLFINPMLVIEDKKAYFGLTKEVSFGYFPFGRFAFEYSFIIRDRNTSHIRVSYNYDFVLEASDFAAVLLTPGAGYFTDTENKGWFAHASFGLLLPIGFVVTSPYIRYRHTFLQKKPAGKTDIDDISLGLGLIFYLNN